MMHAYVGRAKGIHGQIAQGGRHPQIQAAEYRGLGVQGMRRQDIGLQGMQGIGLQGMQSMGLQLRSVVCGAC